MGIYSSVKVKTQLLETGDGKSTLHHLDKPINDIIDFTNGRLITTSKGNMIIVNHRTYEGWGPDYFEMEIVCVPANQYHPYPDSNRKFIGYYLDKPDKLFGKIYRHEVKRDSLTKDDSYMIALLRSEGRWPPYGYLGGY